MAKQKINQNQINMTPMVFALRPNGAASTVTGPLVLVMTSALINVGSGYNTSTGVFTAPKAGKYLVMFTGFKNNDASSGSLHIRQNGATGDRRTYLSGTLYLPVGLNAILQMAVNDTADIYIGSGLIMHGNESSQLVIIYLGD